MSRTFILLFAGIIYFNIVSSQTIDFQKFESLKSAGKVPEDFTKLSSEKYRADKENISSNSSTERKDQETFLLESNFLMDDILHSGQVIFGDPVTNYLNEIKDIILANDPKTANEIRIYTLMSNEVNAFTSDNGIVLVTTGLLAQVENEAQIAFILCHEFNHYIKKHAINNYVENKRIQRGTGIYESLGADEADLAKFRYSKELESEADELGLVLFSKTNYSAEEAQGVFDVLLYSYLPFDEEPFDTTFFNNNGYNIPQKYFTDTVNTITAQEDYDDAESTHPNIKKRRTAMLAATKKITGNNRKAYLLDENKFIYIQKLCRYQGCEIFLNDLEYEDALYQAYLLQLTDTGNIYLNNTIAKALYGLSVYHTADAVPDGHRYYKKVEGQSQQVYYLAYKMPDDELNILAMRNAWEAHLADPENKLISNITKQLAKELVNENGEKFSDFYTEKRMLALEVKNKLTEKETVDTLTVEPEETGKIKTKYDKIKKETPTTEPKKDELIEYWKSAFIPYMNDTAFTNLFVVEGEKVEQTKKRSSKGAQKEYHLGLDKIVVVNPIYASIDERNKNPVEYEAAESSKLDLKNKIYNSAEKLDLDIKYIDDNFIEAKDVDAFNDLAVLNRWIGEELDHKDSGVEIINSSSEEFYQLASKYGTDNFAWMGIIAFREKERNIGGKIFLCLFYPAAPFLIYDMLKPNFSTFFFTLVANSNTGEIEMQYFNGTRLNDNNSNQNSNIYYILQQIKTEEKK